MPITEFFFPEDRPFITEDFFPRVLREGHGEVEIRFRNLRTGEPIWMLYSVVLLRNEAGEPTGLATISRDITERLRGEEAVRRRSEQLRKLADVASRINAARDMASVLELVTEEARTAARGPSIGRRPRRRPGTGRVPSYAVSPSEGIRRTRASPGAAGGPRSLPARPVVPDPHPPDPGGARGGARPGHPSRGRRSQPPLRGLLAVPLFGRDGRVIGVIQLSDRIEGEFTADDEAILVQLAQMASVAIENARLYEQLRDTDRRKDEFLATLAHELRNPLAPIRNALQVIRLADGKARRSSRRPAR